MRILYANTDTKNRDIVCFMILVDNSFTKKSSFNIKKNNIKRGQTYSTDLFKNGINGFKSFCSK